MGRLMRGVVAGPCRARFVFLPGVRAGEESGWRGSRQYFPKGTDFSTVTEVELNAVADELNECPRKRFGFATPTEQHSELLLQ